MAGSPVNQAEDVLVGMCGLDPSLGAGPCEQYVW
jgi:hypothetical protein